MYIVSVGARFSPPWSVVSGVGGGQCPAHLTLTQAGDTQQTHSFLTVVWSQPLARGDPLSIIMMIRGQLVDTSTGASDDSLLEVATCLHLPGFSNVC